MNTRSNKGKKRAAPEALSEEPSASPSVGPSKRPRQTTTAYPLRSRPDTAQPSVSEMPKTLRQSTTAKGKTAAAKSKPMAADNTSTVSVNCILVDHDSSLGYHAFHVEVPPEIKVSHLRKKILEEEKIDVPASRFEMWNGNALRKRDGEGILNSELKKHLHDFDFSVETLPSLSKVRLSEDDIVIIRGLQKADVDVGASGASGPRRKKGRYDIVAKINALPAPSAAADPRKFRSYLLWPGQTAQPSKAYFLCHRPIDYETIPLVLMHPVFGTFYDNIWTLQPSAKDSDVTRTLTHEMSKVYDDEKDRRKQFRSWFTGTYNYVMETKVGPPTTDTGLNPQNLPESDGHVLVENFVILISECKLEAPSTLSDARYELMMYFNKLFAASEASQDHLGHSCLPAILIACEGAHLEVTGVIMHPDGTVQAQTFMSLPLNCDWRDRNQRCSIARFVGALRICLKSLEVYYDNLAKAGVLPVSNTITTCGAERRAPYPRQYTLLNGEIVEFEYIELLFDGRMVFEVKELQGGRRVIVKFAQSYGEDAHRILDHNGAAPKLLAVNELAGGWKMIAMEFLSPDEWNSLEEVPQEARQQYRGKVEEAVSNLHKGGQVHGDVRACNILVPKSSNGNDVRVKFIDFDEAGPPGATKYPPYWNTVDVTRPADVCEGSALQHKHDEFMVKQIFEGDRHKSGTGIRRMYWTA